MILSLHPVRDVDSTCDVAGGAFVPMSERPGDEEEDDLDIVNLVAIDGFERWERRDDKNSGGGDDDVEQKAVRAYCDGVDRGTDAKTTRDNSIREDALRNMWKQS